MKRMKNEKPDELDDNQSIFAIARHHRNRTISKTTHFADISFRVDESVGTLTQRSRSSPVRLGPSTLGWMIESRWDSGRRAEMDFGHCLLRLDAGE